jgi:hypothetical protein
MSRAPQHYDIQQRDDGLWQIGADECALGPFETREFALSVACCAQQAPKIPFRKIKLREARRAGSSP